MFLLGLIAGSAVMIGMSGGLPGTSPAGNTPPNIEAPNNQPQVTGRPKMIAVAEAMELDEAEFTACLDSGKYEEEVMAQMDKGRAEGISGTPGNILINLRTGRAQVLSGAQPYENFKAAIDDMLANPSAPLADTVQKPTVNPTVDPNTDAIRGNRNADIALIEYSDYECPFCSRVHPTYQQLMEDYGDQIMWVYRHFPLESIHPNAIPYAVGAECAKEQGGNDAFWDYTDILFNT